MSSKVLLSIFSLMLTLPAITNALEAPVQSTEESSINAVSEDASNAAGAAELSVIMAPATAEASEFKKIEESVVDYGPVMVDLEGTQVSLQEEGILRHPLVSSVILFSRNMQSEQQLRELIARIRNIKPKILLAVDHEGGNVQRLQRNGFRSWPAARVYGDVYDLNPTAGLTLARNYGQFLGAELSSYGIDINLAPVLDLHNSNAVIGKLDRAFHHDPNVVAELGNAFAEGLEISGISAVGKHVPGHAVCEGDSHIMRPISDYDLSQLYETHLLPFRRLIDNKKLKALMPAHITFTKVDGDNAVGFSKIWLQEILRGAFHFDGAIISDCLSMKGADIGRMSERARCALEAGCDIVIVANQSREMIFDILTDLSNSYRQSSESLNRVAALARV